MGSTDDDVLEALVSCQGEPLGARCEASRFADERPTRIVTLSAYFLDRTEVTVAAHARCVALHRCRPAPFSEGGGRFDRPELPVSLVTWKDAAAYCTFRGGRLPTEAEFERAARGRQGRRYPWGNRFGRHLANHGRLAWAPTDDRDGFAELAPVGAFPAGRTPDGFVDLAGNVAEWVADRYAPGYDPAAVTDPEGPAVTASTPLRVVRGGSYESPAAWLRGATRDAAPADLRRPTVGFRCARDAGRRGHP